jgi:hypothetical protein
MSWRPSRSSTRRSDNGLALRPDTAAPAGGGRGGAGGPGPYPRPAVPCRAGGGPGLPCAGPQCGLPPSLAGPPLRLRAGPPRRLANAEGLGGRHPWDMVMGLALLAALKYLHKEPPALRRRRADGRRAAPLPGRRAVAAHTGRWPASHSVPAGRRRIVAAALPGGYSAPAEVANTSPERPHDRPAPAEAV